MQKDQMPSDGCATCGKYSGETQSVLKKRLVWDEQWLCKACYKAPTTICASN